MREKRCHYMFVRFRQQGARLQASLMQTRRASGTIRGEDIASLGSVDADVSVRERLAFWVKLPERLARLGNRVGAEEHAKTYAAPHARIPTVTPEEQRAIQEENAKDDERFWGMGRKELSNASNASNARLAFDQGMRSLLSLRRSLPREASYRPRSTSV